MARPITLEAVFDALAPWDAHGPWTIGTGAFWWGRIDDEFTFTNWEGKQVPRLNGWMHKVATGVSTERVADYLEQWPLFQELTLKRMWTQVSGLSLFDKRVELNGIRSYSSDQNWDAMYNAVIDMDEAEARDGVFVGFSECDNRQVRFLEDRSGAIRALDRYCDYRELARWDDLETFFWSAVAELNAHWTPTNDYVPSWSADARKWEG